MSDHDAARCSNGLRELARDSRFTPRAHQLEDLAGALADPDNDNWAGVDLFAAFPPEASIRLRHRNAVERPVGVLAAMSVFLPVGWTWLEFHRASAAYAEMIQTGGEPEGRTFLGLWASGFDGRLGARSHLAPMAMVSLSLIVFAIFCIVAHRVIAEANVRREERLFREARTELVQTLTAASLVMNSRRADHPQRIEGIIKSSMDKLRKTQDAARKATLEPVGDGGEREHRCPRDARFRVQSARVETEALLVQAKSTHETLESATKKTGEALSASITSLDTTIKTGVEAAKTSVGESVSAAEVMVRETLHASRSNVNASAEELSRLLSEALTKFQVAMGDHIDDLDRADPSGDRCPHLGTGSWASSSGSARAHSLSAGAADWLSEQVTIMRDDNAAARQDLERAMEDLRSTLEAIEMALGSHESTLQGHACEFTGTRDAAERMLRHLTASVAAVNGNGVPLDARS